MSYYLTKNTYLEHSRKGWTKKNHKYISRVFKNGKWFYVYKNGKKYNRIQDWFGEDERDAYDQARIDAINAENRYFHHPLPVTMGIEQQWREEYESAQKFLKQKEKEFRRTPLGAISTIAEAGQNFITSISNIITGKNKNNSRIYKNKKLYD